MSESPSCRNCALAEWQKTPTGRVRRKQRGTCRWGYEAFFAEVEAKFPASVRERYNCPAAVDFRTGPIWWEDSGIDCPQHVKKD